MFEFPLDEVLSGVFGADGIAVVEIGPTHLQHIWRVALATVSSDSPSGSIAFLESPGGANLGGTRSGNQDTTDLPNVAASVGQRLRARWQLGTPGARCTLSVYGIVQVKGGR